MIIGRERRRHGVQAICVERHRQMGYGVVCSFLLLSSCNQSAGLARITRTEFSAGVGVETTERAVPGPRGAPALRLPPPRSSPQRVLLGLGPETCRPLQEIAAISTTIVGIL